MDDEKREILEALAEMYTQYCGGRSGHMFITAGEHAQEILERYGILTDTNAMGGEGTIDWDGLKNIRSSNNNQ